LRDEYKIGNNGMAYYSSSDCFYQIIPPTPIHEKVYLCARYFEIEKLKKYFSRDPYELILEVDSRKAYFFLQRNNHKFLWNKFEELIPNKHKKGGWSQKRYQENRKLAIQAFAKKIAYFLKESFIENEELKVKRISLQGNKFFCLTIISYLDQRLIPFLTNDS
jgi:peptide subunit release factor 1 (eRF1)